MNDPSLPLRMRMKSLGAPRGRLAAPTAARSSHATISGFRIAVARHELGTQARQRRAAFPEG
jgi:hypothetical protein